MNCQTRWPPVYDFVDLQKQIKTLIDDGVEDDFYNNYPNNDEFYQGDIIELEAPFPFINEDGDIAVYNTKKWLILGNTCDITREDLNFTNIIPLDEIDSDIPRNILNDLRRFQSFKKTYFPDINKKHNGYVADLTNICSINKSFLNKNATKTSELTYPAWILFHSCIVRYFARDDGRHD